MKIKRSSKKRTKKINKIIYRKTNAKRGKIMNVNIGTRWIC